MIKEAELDNAFAEMLLLSHNFQHWVLSGGRFGKGAAQMRLLHREQQEARTAARWWKHWWCRLPDGTEGETDILAIFEDANGERVALHIENKPSHGKLTHEQSIHYRRRAAYKAFTSDWLTYSDFECILLAPMRFLERNADQAALFDRTITYENVAIFVPLFAEAIGSVERL